MFLLFFPVPRPFPIHYVRAACLPSTLAAGGGVLLNTLLSPRVILAPMYRKAPKMVLLPYEEKRDLDNIWTRIAHTLRTYTFL